MALKPRDTGDDGKPRLFTAVGYWGPGEHGIPNATPVVPPASVDTSVLDMAGFRAVCLALARTQAAGSLSAVFVPVDPDTGADVGANLNLGFLPGAIGGGAPNTFGLWMEYFNIGALSPLWLFKVRITPTGAAATVDSLRIWLLNP